MVGGDPVFQLAPSLHWVRSTDRWVHCPWTLHALSCNALQLWLREVWYAYYGSGRALHCKAPETGSEQGRVKHRANPHT
jgi:hypothetical protein